jgi:NAD(P)-dependent dehydrogenase (short-subunit alcohol dehydrogenase family)
MKPKIIFLTGGTGKLGRQMVRHLILEGHTVVTNSRSQGNLDELAASLSATDRFHGMVLDLEAHDALEKALGFLAGRGLQPHAVVHNARSLDYLKIQADGIVTEDNFMGELRMDVVIPYTLTMQLADMPGSRLENVVNISSMYGVIAPNRELYTDFDHQSPINYGVAKAAQVHLTKELAVRLASRGIRVNAISYGGFGGRAPEDFVERYARLNPQGRMLDDSEAPGPLSFLISDASRGMTGHNLVYDSGWSIW